ncbi:MAG: hypothetical protein M3P50_13620 [Actinomycetota bacterium]|nr:hypothetical protein [Actinomycetota bacterium]
MHSIPFPRGLDVVLAVADQRCRRLADLGQRPHGGRLALLDRDELRPDDHVEVLGSPRRSTSGRAKAKGLLVAIPSRRSRASRATTSRMPGTSVVSSRPAVA